MQVGKQLLRINVGGLNRTGRRVNYINPRVGGAGIARKRVFRELLMTVDREKKKEAHRAWLEGRAPNKKLDNIWLAEISAEFKLHKPQLLATQARRGAAEAFLVGKRKSKDLVFQSFVDSLRSNVNQKLISRNQALVSIVRFREQMMRKSMH